MNTRKANNFGSASSAGRESEELAHLRAHDLSSQGLPAELASLATELDGSRAQLSEAALQRLIAGTLATVREQRLSNAAATPPALRLVGHASSVPVPAQRAGNRAMRMAAAIGLVASVGAAIVAQRSSTSATPLQVAASRAASSESRLASAGAAASAASATDDELVLWESWLAAADVSTSRGLTTSSTVDSQFDRQFDRQSPAEAEGTEAGNAAGGENDELNWLDGLDGLSDFTRGAAVHMEGT